MSEADNVSPVVSESPEVEDVPMTPADGSDTGVSNDTEVTPEAGGEIGWDPKLVPNNTSESSTPVSAEGGGKKKKDALDYSRFYDNISDSSDEDVPAVSAPVVPKKVEDVPCRNCTTPSAKLRCSICRKVVYCNRDCQKDDWRYHKRTCKKPEKKKEDKKSDDNSTSSSPSTSASATSPSASKPARKPKTEVVKDEKEEDDPDLSDVKGYRYFSRQLSQEENDLIGSIAPKKLDVAAGGDGAASNAPVPIVAAATATPVAAPRPSGSAWNTCGTWEERDVTNWAKDRMKELLAPNALTVPPEVGEQGSDLTVEVEVTGVKSIEGDAQLTTVRGKARRLFDFHVKLEWTARVLTPSDLIANAQAMLAEMGGDLGEAAAAAAAELTAAMAATEEGEGEGEDGGGDEEKKDKKKSKKKGKVYKGVLDLPDVSSTAGGEYEMSVEWKKRPSGDHFTLLNAALGRAGSGMQAQLTSRVATFVEEYNARTF